MQNGRGSLYETQRRERRKKASVRGRAQMQMPSVTAVALKVDLPTLEISNGRFTIGKRLVWGGSVNDAWWRGQTSPAAALSHGVSVTRFVPGRIGPGLTEDLDAFTDRIAAQRTPFYQTGPGLWYDRRRDDHTTGERSNGNVWAPFYELPWARSGRRPDEDKGQRPDEDKRQGADKGKAWDGLSRYDLSRFNPWYFERMREFHELCDRKGIVVYHNLYNTHNLLEIVPHWCDYPWRPANNINDTGLPEPMPSEPGERIHVANQFYNTEYAPRETLHRAYIEQVLDELGTFRNVIFSVAYQFSGPLAFQEYFLDVVSDWSARQSSSVPRPRIALATSKDITDAILQDPKRSAQIDVIDTRYWQYRPDGTLWAPEGGRNLAFREMVTRDFGRMGDFPPATSVAQAIRQVREYRKQFPDKAVVAWHNGVGQMPALMGGAAQVLMRNPTAGHDQGRTIDRTAVDDFIQQHCAEALPGLMPTDAPFAGKHPEHWALADSQLRTVLIYSTAGKKPIPWRKGFNPALFDQRWLNLDTGVTQAINPTSTQWALWLRAVDR